MAQIAVDSCAGCSYLAYSFYSARIMDYDTSPASGEVLVPVTRQHHGTTLAPDKHIALDPAVWADAFVAYSVHYTG